MQGEFDRAMRHGISAARWLLAPMYLGVGLMLVVLLVQFVRDFFQGLPVAFSSDALTAARLVLSLAAVLLIAGLVLAILHTGQSLFAPQADTAEAPEPERREIAFARLLPRFLSAAIVLVLLFAIDRMIASQAGGWSPETLPWPLFVALGVLVAARLVLEIADWFGRLARKGGD
ncbi:MAG: hypothetical protein D6754_06710 [Alphaproteobacteria bacterium]|nr:MAG: hypothetical protein D6754_06710 [Alphaproteobacteria bacterium]